MTHEILPQIEAYINRTGISAKAFGRAAGCGSSLVYGMRDGSKPKPETIAKIHAFLGGMGHVTPRYNRQPERIDPAKLTRVDSRACFNCGAAYARCACHGSAWNE